MQGETALLCAVKRGYDEGIFSQCVFILNVLSVKDTPQLALTAMNDGDDMLQLARNIVR